MKLLQVDSCLGVGSTGRITESIAHLAQNRGWECYIIHGARYVKRPSCMEDIQSVTKAGEYIHYVESLLFDNHGLSSRYATKRVIEQIKRIKPDVIQLHCVHGYYLNYKILFEYLNTTDIPVVWTFHDCWAFTGHCAHFVSIDCEQWKDGCYCCQLLKDYPKSFFDKSQRNYQLKKSLFTVRNDLTTVVPVSYWLEGLVKESFFKDCTIHTIYNGVDINRFKPRDDLKSYLDKYNLEDKKYIMGVATAWSERKGYADYCKLSSLLPEDVKIVLVGLDTKKREEVFRYGIIGIARTENVEELVALYNGAAIVMNLSYEETFGLTTVEGFACGTPSIVYNATASPELVTPETGIAVEPSDIDGVARAVDEMLEKGKNFYSSACRERAETCFDKDEKFQEYLNLYERLIK